MMKQFHDIKNRYHDEILFFRMGDFYEMFGEDAEKASKILGIALTKRNNIPMCGIPHHAKDNYLFKLIKAGYKVAICDQLEDPSTAKGIVKRGVTEVITPGTLIDDRLLDQMGQAQNNYIMALQIKAKSPDETDQNIYVLGLAYLDLSTGDFIVYENDENNVYQAIVDQLYRISPKELILPESLKENRDFQKLLARDQKETIKNYLADYRFDLKQGETILLEELKVSTLKGFGIEKKPLAVGAAGSLLYYLKETQLRDISHLSTIHSLDKSQFMELNESTLKNLELTSNIQDGTRKHTLFSVLNKCKTAMGSRKLNRWILQPLMDRNLIKQRQEVVSFFFHDGNLLLEIQNYLDSLMDVERLLGKIALDKASPRGFIGLKHSLLAVQNIFDKLSKYPVFSRFTENSPDFTSVITLIQKALMDEPDGDLSSGSVIREGYHLELDNLKAVSREGRDFIIELQEKERSNLRIANLRIKYNKVIGYFIEVSKGNTKNVPDHYIKKQSLTNATRYTLPELTEYESKILGAQEKILALERELFESIRLTLCDHLGSLKTVCERISEIDILGGFAYTALHQNYIMPELSEDKDLIIKDGRHPVVEMFLKDDEFIPNDLIFQDTERLHIITGPNMAGKSTFLRQAALLVIMAQIGSFIPAQYAKIPIIDKIFTRIGASDNLARGESTFLVEMIEAALILNNATERSLIIMDEIGRGTSTYDGLSIAWSIVEYLALESRKLGKVLFATHYHELTSLAKEQGIQSFQVLVREWGDEIIFLHKVDQGSGGKSYGIQVARLAGLPNKVIQRAKEILSDLENRNYEVEDDLLKQEKMKDIFQQDQNQLSLFPVQYDRLAKEILKLDVNTPPTLLSQRLEQLQAKIRRGDLS